MPWGQPNALLPNTAYDGSFLNYVPELTTNNCINFSVQNFAHGTLFDRKNGVLKTCNDAVSVASPQKACVFQDVSLKHTVFPVHLYVSLPHAPASDGILRASASVKALDIWRVFKMVHQFPYITYNDNKLKTGGRLYGTINNFMNDEMRNWIVSDFQETCEADFSSQHIYFLYAEAGEQLYGKPYKLDTYPWNKLITDEVNRRTLLKKLLLRLPNSVIGGTAGKIAANFIYDKLKPLKERKRKDGTIIKPIHEQYVAAKKRKEAYIKKYGRRYLTNDKVKILVQALIDKHSHIKHLFFTNSGGRLQNIDSAIMLNLHMYWYEKGVSLISTYDSVVIPKQHEAELLRVMNQFHREEMIKRFGKPFNIDIHLFEKET